MATEIGGKRPERPAGRPGPGFILRWLGTGAAPVAAAQKDDLLRDRALRLEAFSRGHPVPEVWTRDLGPMFSEAFDAEIRGLIEVGARIAEMNPAALAFAVGRLTSLHDLYTRIDAHGELASGTAARLARRVLQGMAAADLAGERRPERTNPT